jgi:signal transduction histidine kinase
MAGDPSLEDAHVVATAAVGAEAAFDLSALRSNPLHAAEAEREIMRRSVVSTFTQSLMLVAIQVVFSAGGPRWVGIPATVLVIVLTAVRWWTLGLVRRGEYTYRLRYWLLAVTTIGIVGMWGIVEAGHLHTHGATFETQIITVLICGLALGLMLTFAPDRRLQMASMLALLGPVPLWSAIQGTFGAWEAMHVAYFLYASVQGRVLYRDYWRAIGTSDLLARHADSLRKADVERKQLQENLRFAERMASLGTLAAGVAHEINNPMTYVLGNLDYIAEELPRHPSPAWGAADPSLEQLIKEAQDGARRVVRIVRDLKTFSRHSDDDPLMPVELEAVLDTAADIARAQIRHRAQLVRDYRGATKVLGDSVRLGQVFVNLVVNAAQAIPEGEDQEKHRIVLRTYLDDEGRAVGEVEDSGVGVDPAHLPRLFDPFFTTKPVGIGTGLGLSSAMGIVSALGGTMDVESTVGVGTIVRVRLPRLADQPLLKAG